ncbi:MAG: RNA polymerase sigma factor [Planctomycetes bacterium]|nr:RNA polymerase sigma factor [Planctomycetota bacterium]
MPDSDDSDATAVRQTLAGDRDAFARLVEKYGQSVHQQMRSFAPDPAESEELAHEVFVEAYLSLESFRGDAPFRHWLARIATFTGYRFWKTRKKRRREVPLPDLDNQAAAPVAMEGARSPDAARVLLLDMLALLPERDRLLLTLAYVEGCQTADIATRLGWSRTTVAMRTFKAKQKLKRLADKEPWKGKLRWMIS